MALVKCKECGTDISDKAGACPKCGAPAKAPTKQKSGWGAALSIFAGVLVLVTIWGAFSDPGPAMSKKPQLMKLSDGTLTEEKSRSFGEYVRIKGYACPSANAVRPLDLQPEGMTYRVYCGFRETPDRAADALTYWVATGSGEVKPCDREPRC